MNAPRNERVRIRFSKAGRIRFTSHRDVARIWERTLRRTRIPVAYSEGFSPRPRLRFGLALATAYESCGEYLDVDVPAGTPIDHAGLPGLLDGALPPGLHVQAVAPVPPGSPSLQESVESCTWLVEVPSRQQHTAADLVSAVLDARELEITRTRKGKDVVDDVRPAIIDVRTADEDEVPDEVALRPAGALLRAELATHPRACRPGELLAAMSSFADTALEEGRVVRLHQWTSVDGVRREPIPIGDPGLARPSTEHATARAS